VEKFETPSNHPAPAAAVVAYEVKLTVWFCIPEKTFSAIDANSRRRLPSRMFGPRFRLRLRAISFKSATLTTMFSC